MIGNSGGAPQDDVFCVSAADWLSCRTRMEISMRRMFQILAAMAMAAAAMPLRAAVSAPVPPWERASIYYVPPTNKPGRPPPTLPTSRDVLNALENEAPTSLAAVVLGSSPSLYAMSRQSPTNLPADAKTMEQEHNFAVMIRDVDRMSKEGRAEEAINMLKEQLNKPMPPHQRAAINNRIASYYFRMQRYAQAMPFMREAVRLDPTDFPTLCNLAAVLMSMGETKEASFFLMNIDTTKIQNNDRLVFSVFFNRACLASLDNQLGTAIQELRKAAQTDPHQTLASLGDPQLDAIRPSLDFFDLRARLEAIIAPLAPVTSRGSP